MQNSRGDDDHFFVTRSPMLLDSWAEAETNFGEEIQTWPLNMDKIEPEQLNKLFDYFRDFNNCTKNICGYGGSLQEKINSVTYNPIATFRMIRRILNELKLLKEIEFDSEGKSMDSAFDKFPEDGWLREDDFIEAISAILRISHTYGLKAKDLAQGVILGKETGIQLQAVHCYEIGLEATVQKFHVLSIDWMELAMEKADDKTVELALIQQAYQEAIRQHDITTSSDEPIDDSQVYDQLLAPIQNEPNFTSLRQDRREILIQQFGGNFSSDSDGINNYVNYWLLCSGHDLQSAQAKSKLFCWYERKINAYWSIGPVKMELLATSPDIVQMYDVIGDGMIQRLKEEAVDNLMMSKVIGPTGDAVSTTRTSVQAWLQESFIDDLKMFPRNIELLTGLNVIGRWSAELLQVAAYTFSGHFDIHVDALLSPNYINEKEAGNRVATFMYYLHQPELGGQTVFPQAGVAAQPIKGSAVFWYDVMRNGSVDHNTFHGGCPVVYGRKWISNKWVRYFDQMNNRKCGLKPNDRFNIHLETRGR